MLHVHLVLMRYLDLVSATRVAVVRAITFAEAYVNARACPVTLHVGFVVPPEFRECFLS